MKTLLIVWHSRTGGARAMAEAAAAGAEEEPLTRTRLLMAEQATGADVMDADGYVFAMPENLAALSGPMKDFFDRAYYPALDRIAGRPYALLVCAGTDGTNAVRQVARIATGWRLRAIAEPLIVVTGAQTAEAILAPKTIAPDLLARCRDVGTALASGLAAGIF